MLDRPVCPCGEPDIEVTIQGHRGILDVNANKMLLPVTATCLEGHTREMWVEHHEAVEIAQALLV